MERPRPSTLAWVGLAAGVAAWDAFCPNGETLSERLDSPLERGGWRRAATLGMVAYTAAHLVNVLPESLDGFHQLSRMKNNP